MKTSPKFGIGAFLFGGVALLLAVMHFWLGPISKPEPLQQVVVDEVVKIRDTISMRLQGRELESPPAMRKWNADRVMHAVTAGAGVVAVLLGLVAFIRRENLRLAGSAILLGGLAIAFQFVAAALGAILLVIVIVAVLGAIGLS